MRHDDQGVLDANDQLSTLDGLGGEEPSARSSCCIADRGFVNVVHAGGPWPCVIS